MVKDSWHETEDEIINELLVICTAIEVKESAVILAAEDVFEQVDYNYLLTYFPRQRVQIVLVFPEAT